MTGYSTPPQAYTRDTLVKAIDWIAHQPEALRAQATTADTLVGLYLQSKRRNGGSAASSYPVSGEAFTEDLKSLARDLEQFSAPPHAAPTPPPTQTVPPPVSQMPPPAQTHSSPRTPQWSVDSKSWAQAQMIKERLNLSSESEAIRMMIALGAERLSGLIS